MAKDEQATEEDEADLNSADGAFLALFHPYLCFPIEIKCLLVRPSLQLGSPRGSIFQFGKFNVYSSE